MAAKLHRISLMATKEGLDCAQKIFIPAPTSKLDEEAKQLEKYRKEREASKKKEATRSKFFWKRQKFSQHGAGDTGMNIHLD
jgi:hypothetical protein